MKFVLAMVVAVTMLASAVNVFAQGGAPATDQPAQTTQPEKPRAAGTATQNQIKSEGYAWSTEVFAPLVRFVVVVLILAILVWWLDLPAVLKQEAWSERTVVALVIVFTFCAAALMNTNDEILRLLKDVTLVVLGFYFGASKGSKEEQPLQRKQQETGQQGANTAQQQGKQQQGG